MTSRFALALLAVGLSGCGARTELSDAAGSGSNPSGAGGAGATSSGHGGAGAGAGGSTSSSGTGAGGGTPCTLGFAPIVPLAPEHVFFTGAAVDGDHLLLVTGDHPGYAAQTLSFDLQALGPLHAVPLHNAGEVAPTFAAGFGHALLVESGGHGCRAVALDLDGNPLGGITNIDHDDDICWWTTATPGGFLSFSTPYFGSPVATAPLSAHVLGVDGTVTSTSADIMSAPPGQAAQQLASVALDDQSVVVFWVLTPTGRVYGQRFGADGEPLTEPVDLLPESFRLVALSLGSTLLLAWNEGPANANSIRTATLDAALNLGPIQTIAPAPTSAIVKRISSAGPFAAALLVTSDLVAPEDSPMVGRLLTADGSVHGPPMTSALVDNGSFGALVGTPNGAVLFGVDGKHAAAQRLLCD